MSPLRGFLLPVIVTYQAGLEKRMLEGLAFLDQSRKVPRSVALQTRSSSTKATIEKHLIIQTKCFSMVGDEGLEPPTLCV